jgi:hypothetical protein
LPAPASPPKKANNQVNNLVAQSPRDGAANSHASHERATAFQGHSVSAANSPVQTPPTAPKHLPTVATTSSVSHNIANPPFAVAHSTASPAGIGDQPDSDKRWTTYYLAAAMVALALFCLAPAMPHINLGLAPNWARAVLLISFLQLAYGLWAASIPDWSTLRASMIILTAIAATYGLVMTVALTTPLEQTLPLDLTDVRRQAVLWCGCVMLLASLLAYLCGRAAWRWRRTLELLRG